MSLQENDNTANKSFEMGVDIPSIKEETDPETSSNKLPNVMVQIKTEENMSDDLMSYTNEIDLNFHLKEEILLEGDTETNTKSIEIEIGSSMNNVNDAITKTEEIEHEGDNEVKEEMIMGDDSLVSYDYPNFDDAGSMDSNYVAVLGNVETCLREDYNIKSETEPGYEGRAMIARIFHFLQEEYNFMKTKNVHNCDLSPLANVTKRTAEATGVSEHTVIKILREENTLEKKDIPSTSANLTSSKKKRLKRENK